MKKNGEATLISFSADREKGRLQWLKLCSCNCREQPEMLSHMDTKIYYKTEKV